MLFISLSMWLPLTAQTPHSMEMELEAIADATDAEDADWSQIAEQLEQIREQRININSANKDILGELPFLNAFQIHNIIQYVDRFGPIKNPYELMAIRTIDMQTAKSLNSYVYFGDSKQQHIPWRNIFKYGRHNIITRWDRVLQERKGHQRRRIMQNTGEDQGSHYLGDPNRFLVRHRFTFSRHLQFGFAAEKDPGEPWGLSPLGFDFVTAHLSVSNIGRIKSIVVGDFQAQFGQGLAVWSSMAFNKSAMSLNSQRFGRGLIPSSGVNENRYYRGIGTTLDLGVIDAAFFYSRTHVDASRNSEVESTFAGLQQSGLHRTPNEIASRNALGITSYGSNITYSKKSLSLGATYITNQHDEPIIPNAQLYRKNQFTGNGRHNLSVDYQWLLRGIQFYGEIATNEQRAVAMAHGAYVHIDKHLIFNLHYRDLHPKYDALFMAPFSEAPSGGSGERGTYLGVQWNHNAHVTSNAYADHYQFRWLRFRSSAPSIGSDYLWQTQIKINKKSNTYSRIRFQQRELNGLDDQIIRALEPEKRLSFRQHVSYASTEKWTFASRVEYSFYQQNNKLQNGWLLYQDIRYSFPQKPIMLTMRYALFDTDGFNARIYAYEHDVLYAFSIPAYFNQGTRVYFLCKWQISGGASMWLRYAQTRYNNAENVGSGLNQISGNRIDDIRIQLRIKL